MLLFPTVALVLENQWGLSFGSLLQLSFWGYLVYGLAALPAGWLGDRWSTRGMMAVYMIGTGVSTFLTGFAETPLQMAIGLATIGLFASIYHPVGTSFIVRHAISRGSALGTNGVFGTVGVAMAAVIAGALIDTWGWRAAFFVPGFVCLVTGCAFVLLSESEGKETMLDRTSPRVHNLERRTIIRAFSILAVTMTCAGFITQGFLVSLPKIFDERVVIGGGNGVFGTASLVTIALLVGATGQLIGGRLADRVSIKYVYLFMFVLLIPVAICSASFTGASLVASAAIIQFLIAASLPAENCLVARFCPDDWHARAYGVKFVLALGVASLAVPLAGIVRDMTGGFFWFFLAIAWLAAVVALCALFLPKSGTGSDQSLAEAFAGPAE